MCFFDSHDPTAKNKQGAHLRRQYKSAIFYTNSNQQKIASLLSVGTFSKITIEISAFDVFYLAEEYHGKECFYSSLNAFKEKRPSIEERLTNFSLVYLFYLNS